jgi:hypothetical protein
MLRTRCRLSSALCEKNYGHVLIVIQSNPKVVNEKNSDGLDAVFEAVKEQNSIATICHLLTSWKKRRNNGMCLLEYVVSYGLQLLLVCLLSKKQWSGQDKHDALLKAVQMNHAPIATTLVKYCQQTEHTLLYALQMQR